MSRPPRGIGVPSSPQAEPEVERLRQELARVVAVNRRMQAEYLLYQLRIRELGTALQEKHEEFLEMLQRLQQREEQAVQRSEERFRLLIESVRDYAIFMLDPLGRVTSWNTGAERLTSYTEEEILGRSMAVLYPAEQLSERSIERELLRAARAGRLEYEDWRVRKDGSRFWASVLLTVLRDADGRLLGFVKITRDLTEKRRAEEALRRTADELRRSNQELEQFAYVASHDLQEPLRKIEAFGDRLQTHYYDLLGDRGRDYVDRMRSAAGRMHTLIDDVLTLSRITTRAQPFALIDLTAVVRDVVSDLEVRLEQTGGRVELEELITVEGDAGQMRRLFQNLIGNALKFHTPGVAPVVRIWGEALEPGPGGSGAAPPDRYRIAVQDNGIGFDVKYLDRIFDVFQRLHGREHYEGTGMGLAICRKIVERHGGSITAESAPGAGATFWITLPLTDAAARRKA